MLYPLSILSLVLLALIHLTDGTDQKHIHPAHSTSTDKIPFETRAYWMRRAISALAELESPCPFAAFGTVIVNHTDTSSDPKGKLVCMGVNQNSQSGNPTLHGKTEMLCYARALLIHRVGEIAAINNCSSILTDPNGSYKLTSAEALKAYRSLSLYTTAEACPMCASAIRWSGFVEYIYATSIDTLFEKGWGQISISSEEVFEESSKLPGKTFLVANVLANETDALFSWQYDRNSPCPAGCMRVGGKSCTPVAASAVGHEL